MHGLINFRAATTAAVVWALLPRGYLALEDVGVASFDDSEILNSIDDPNSYYTALHPCPLACGANSPSNWTIYTSFDRLSLCDEPLLFDFSLHNQLSDPSTPTKIRICTEGGDPDSRVNPVFNGSRVDEAPAALSRNKFRRAEITAGTCGASPIPQSSASFQLSSQGQALGQESSLVTALDRLQDFFNDEISCGSDFMFSYNQGVIAGAYIGHSFGRDTLSSVARSLKDTGSISAASTVVAQLCGTGRNANHVFGVIVSSNIDTVQAAVKGWANAECVTGLETQKDLKDLNVWESTADLGNLSINGTTNFTRRGESRTPSHQGRDASLVARADCTTTTVVAGDGCGTLASRCGITAAKFTEFNPGANLCSTLVPGQRVCCSAGTLPDITPKPNPDGTCASYLVTNGDTCSGIAVSHGLTTAQLDAFNKGIVWGWYGCDRLLSDVYICLSTGKPPLPYPISNAVCGPTKPGSTLPTDGTALADLNPCPLNVCCNVWGQCGISDDFCTYSPGPSPGTSTIQNGCVSNCGHDIKNNQVGPSSYGRVGYYETWNYGRDCLHMASAHSNTDGSYTHIHWAFAAVNTADWTVKIIDDYKQWESFKQLPLKRIVSFGGWGYSTEPGTYDVLRQAMSPANRAAFAKNVAKFVNDEGIDGVDFDWEYPGAIDIPGTPPGNPDDGANYLKFLATMRAQLQGKSLSIAAPASYWYLKAFPIKQMAAVLDYIVYMTYDLHGQWDAGSQFSVDGCPAGNCLRSHVNLTETMISLSMITKAGVPTNKIFVGESSYGRSFKMSQAGCTGPMCTFTGDRLNSNAAKGICTDTAGYISNAEIENIILVGDSVNSFHDGNSNSDILVYDETEWVAYMSATTKKTRRDFYKGFNFAGTIDWAVDLQAFTDDDIEDPLDDSGIDDGGNFPADLEPCTGQYSDLDSLEAAAGSIPDHCKPRYIAEILKGIQEQSMRDYDALISGGYDKKFNTYADAIVRSGQSVVDKFMHDHGNDYFTCVVTETVMACNHCNAGGPPEGFCRYCENYDDGWSSICDQPEVFCGPYELRYRNISGPCSPDFSQRAGSEGVGGYQSSVYWSFRDGRQDAFYAELYANAGIMQEDVRFETRERADCGPQDGHCADRDHDYNYPTVRGYTRDDVLNPKSVVSSGYDDLKNLGPDMGSVVEMIQNDAFPGDDADLIDAVALPVFLVQDAVKQMTDIDDTVDKWEDEKRKNIILAFLTAIFFFIPVIGEVIGTVTALAGIARIITVLGTLGEVATDIYSMVDDKDNIPLAIFSIVLAPLAIMDAVQIGRAAARRADMTPQQIKALGDRISTPLNKCDNIKGKACKLPVSLTRRMFNDGGFPMSNLNGEQIWGWNM